MASDSAAGHLRAIKLFHTLVWAFFAGCTMAIPVYALTGGIGRAVLFIVLVFVEVLVLVANSWSCPLTSIAARYTDERRDNFDIYLPEWLARENKTIFGVLYPLGILITIAEAAHWLPPIR
jgi:hypothetical protein